MNKLQRELTPEEIELKNKYKVVFNCPVGRDVLKDLGKKCYLDKSNYVPGRPIEDMVNKDGARMIILKILKMCDIDILDLIGKF